MWFLGYRMSPPEVPSLLATYMPNNGWNLVSSEAVVKELTYDCCEGVYPELMVYLHFQRKSMFYVVNLIFPMVVITILTFLAFILPQESGNYIVIQISTRVR